MGQADDGKLLDHEDCERPFNVPAAVKSTAIGSPPEGFAANVKRQIEATLSRALEDTQRRQRQQIFAVEDEINGKRDALEKRMTQQNRPHRLLRVRWRLG